MNDALKQRLVGALVLLGAALLFAFLLPSPGKLAMEEGTRMATIDLHAPEGGVELVDAARVTPPVIAAPAPRAGADSAETAATAVNGEPDVQDPAPGKRAAPPTYRAPPLQLKSADRLQHVPPVPSLAMTGKPVEKPTEKPAAKLGEKPVAKPSLAPAVPAARPATPPAMVATAPAVKPLAPPAAASVPAKPATPTPGPTTTAAAPATQPATGARWSVQIGSFSEVGNAKQAESRIEAAGMPCIVLLVDTPKGKLYRVRIGPLPGEGEAQAARSKALQLGFGTATVRQD